MVESPFHPHAGGAWFDPTDSQLRVAVLLGAATVLYLAYYLVITPPVVARLFPTRTSEVALRTTASFFRKAVGALLFGLIPAIGLAVAWPGGLTTCGLSLHDASRSLLFGVGFVVLMVPLLVMQARKPSFRDHYPEVRVPFTRRVAAWNAIAWAVYLVAYEFFFRGVLVLGLATLIGPLPALAVSLMGYVFVHLGRYAGETVGTLFTGTLFGIIALETGSILMPVIAHLGVALTSDYLAARVLRATDLEARDHV